MQIYVVNTGFFKLDGGAMFGVVPKTIWQKLNPADDNNLCTWAMRSILIEDGNRLVLVDTGIGNKQPKEFLKFYHLHGDDSLEGSLQKLGFKPEDITDVLLTHLHLDHCGGGVKRSAKNSEQMELTFPNAKYWSNRAHWGWAAEPNPREKASFLKENIIPIQESGHLHFVDFEDSSPFPGIELIAVDGHTEKQMLPKIRYKDKVLVFTADLIPSAGHIPVPYVMGYDTRPLLSMQEKESLLREAADNGYYLIFEHDPHIECCTVKHTEKGVRMDQILALGDL
jgi:glyoxylase-like metal-dependent hydrolase (beta-lactamase superfamily II)